MAVDFCDYFWGEEHNGWNVLYQNMKQGQTAGKELAEIFKERWSLDEAYSKSLVKLSNKAGSNTEKGTCAPLFAVLKSSSEKLSNVHTVTVQRVQDLTKDVTKYNDELHKKHKGVKDEESQTEEIVKSIQTTEGLAHKAKETYSQRCQDLEKVKRDGASPKDIEKAEAKLRKAHDEYKALVEKYNTIRDEFERKLSISCQKFQTVEESHLGATLQFVQTYIEVLQTSHEAIGQIHSELLNQYNQFSIDKLLNTFSLAKHTGLEKPNPMVFEDAGSVGSVISGQQSPEPGEASKLSAAEDVITTGGGGSSSGGGGSGSGIGGSSVLSGGSVLSIMGGKKEGRRVGGVSMFSRAASRCASVTSSNSSSNQQILPAVTGTSAAGAATESCSSSSSVCVSPSSTNHHRTNKQTTVTTTTPDKTSSSNNTRGGPLNTTKASRRTTSLLNLFVASTSASASGLRDREWSAPPSCDTGGGQGEDVPTDGGEEGAEEHPQPSSPTYTGAQVTSAPTSPSHEDPSGLARSVFRSSKWFLRSRRDKKKEKKSKKVKGTDTSSNKEEKSDNEGGTDDIVGPDLIMGSSSGNQANCSSSSSVGGGTTTQAIDHEGFSIKPHEKTNPETVSIESSSESDSESEPQDKKIHVEIKPISNGGAPISASKDELRAIIETISLSPVPSFPSTRRTSSENQEPMKRSTSITQQLSGSGSSAADLLGLDLVYSGAAGHNNSNTSPNPTTNNSSDTSITRPFSPQTHGQQAVNYSGQLTSPAPSTSSLASAASVASPVFTAPPRADRYAELSDLISSDVTNQTTVIGTPEPPPALPPRQGLSSRGSTPTPSTVVPRPPSRKALDGPSPRGRQSPFPSSAGLSRAESVSSLDFRTTSMTSTGMGTSRGPSPLTIGMSDTIPLAIAFQELCHSYFRGTDEARCQVKVTGEMMVSFPAGIVGVLANNPSPAQLSFKVSNFSRVDNVLPNKQLITLNEEQSTEDTGVFEFNMLALTSLLKKQAENNPSASYFNVDMIKYQVSNISGAVSTPLQLVSYWKCEDNHTDLRVDYKYNPNSMASPSALLNVNVSVPVDGVVKNMQSKPQGQWLRDQQRAVWKITELSQHSASGGVGSLRAKFEVAAGPSTPATIQGQFNCEGTTMSGLEFDLASSGYRVSLIKRRFVSGKYICDADAVLRLRYGSV